MNPGTRKRLLMVAILALMPLGVDGVAGAGWNTWTPLGPEGAASISSIAVDPVTPSTIYAGGFNRVYKSVNFGMDWTPVGDGVLPHPISALLIDPTAPGTVYAGSNRGGAYKSVNGGGSWRPVSAGLQSAFISALAIDPRNPRTLYAGAMEYGCEGPCAFKSTDGAESWVVIGDGRIPADILELQVDPVNPNRVYAGTYGSGLFKSEDGGDTWRLILAGESPTYVLSVAVDPSNPTTVYAARDGYPSGPYPVGGVVKSTDGGNTWRGVNQGILSRSVTSLAINPQNSAILYAGTPDGVFRSGNGGESWSAISAGLTSKHVNTLTPDPNNPDRLYAGTQSGGVFVYQESETCAPHPETLCLRGGRFAATTRWTTRDGRTGSGNAFSLTGDAGYFTFFDAANVEMIVKVLNGCGVNSHHWVFAAGLTDVEVVLTVTDSLTGGTFRTYTNPQGAPFQPVQDTSAFSYCP